MTTELATPSEHQNNHQQKSGLSDPTWQADQDPQQQQSQQQTIVAQSVLTDPNIKFPLENSWSFWFYKNDKSKSWKDNVKFITTVDFVEDFWGVYNHLQLVSKMSPGCDYMFFKKDIPPMWEDPQNLDGGRWVLNLDKKYRGTSLDVYWLNTLLALIGDQFMDESAYVNGVWVNIRAKMDKIALWTKSAKDVDVQMKIGQKYREVLGLKEGMITYEEHDDGSKKNEAPLLKC